MTEDPPESPRGVGDLFADAADAADDGPPPRQQAPRGEVLAAKAADEELTRGGVALDDPRRLQYRRDGETGRYTERKSRRRRQPGTAGDDDRPATTKQWIWFARAPAFRGKTVGEWRAEAAKEGGALGAKYRLLKGEDADPIVRGSREDVYYERAHVTNTSARLIRADLTLSKKGTVVSRTKSDHSKRMMGAGMGPARAPAKRVELAS